MKKIRLLSLLVLTSLFSLLVSCGTVSPSRYNLNQLPSQYSQIALLLPLHGNNGEAGNAIRNGFITAYYTQQSQGESNTSIKVYDTSQNQDIRSLYSKAVSDGAQLVIGPLDKGNVKALSGANIRVPTIALNYLNSDSRTSPLFFQFGISPQVQAAQVAEKAAQQGLRSAIIIAPDAAWGRDIANAFTTRWQQFGGTVVDSLYYQPNQNLNSAIKNLLRADTRILQSKNKPKNPYINYQALRRQDMDVIFMVAPPSMARQIVPLLQFYFIGNTPIYSTAMIYQGVSNPSYNRDMNGVIFPDIPWVFNPSGSEALEQRIQTLWPQSYNNNARLYALGIDAYTLSQNLKNLSTSPQFGIAGNTGQLYLGNNHQILQHFQWAQFQNGEAVTR